MGAAFRLPPSGHSRGQKPMLKRSRQAPRSTLTTARTVMESSCKHQWWRNIRPSTFAAGRALPLRELRPQRQKPNATVARCPQPGADRVHLAVHSGERRSLSVSDRMQAERPCTRPCAPQGCPGERPREGGWESRLQSISWLSRQEPSCKNPLKSIDAYNDCKDEGGYPESHAEPWPGADALQRPVRRSSSCNIPIADGKDSEDILGSAANLNSKGRGTRACRQSRERREDAETVARRDPRDMAKAALLEVQCPSSMEGLWRQRLTARWTRRTGKRTAWATSAGPAPPNEGGDGMNGPPTSR